MRKKSESEKKCMEYTFPHNKTGKKRKKEKVKLRENKEKAKERREKKKRT